MMVKRKLDGAVNESSAINRIILDLYISAMHEIFIQKGAIILDPHTLNIRRSMLSFLSSLFSKSL